MRKKLSDKRVDRRKSAGLPKRWRYRDGAYYYRVPTSASHLWGGKTEVKLGNTLHEAHLAFSEKAISADGVRTVRQLADKYEIEEVALKSPETQRSERYSLKFVRELVGHFLIDELKGREIRKIMILIGKEYSAKRAHLVRGVISHMYTMALEWGDYEGIHPVVNKQAPMLTEKQCKKLGIKPDVPRKKYVTDEELVAICSVANPVIKAYIPLKVAIGQRLGDMLTIKLEHIEKDCLHIKQNKSSGGRHIIFPFKDDDGSENGLRELVENAYVTCRARIKNLDELDEDPDHLFCNRDGKPYFNYENRRHDGWDAMWQRMMQKAAKMELIKRDEENRFTEHDLRAKTASDAMDLETARRLMGHTDARTTDSFYRRNGDVVPPLLSKLWRNGK